MNAKRELVKIVNKNSYEVYWSGWNGKWEDAAEKTAQAILDAGFVRIEDVEMDLRKLATLLMGLAHQRATGVRRTWYKEAELINKMKGILKIKEAKNEN